jgi:hypothetical protein
MSQSEPSRGGSFRISLSARKMALHAEISINFFALGDAFQGSLFLIYFGYSQIITFD